MKIAISTIDNKGLESNLSPHFGRCPFYIMVETKGEEILSAKGIENPYYSSHEPGMVPEFINKQGVDVMISGGMGRSAINFFKEFEIGVATGASGTVKETLQAYFEGKLQEAAPCNHEDHDH